MKQKFIKMINKKEIFYCLYCVGIYGNEQSFGHEKHCYITLRVWTNKNMIVSSLTAMIVLWWWKICCLHLHFNGILIELHSFMSKNGSPLLKKWKVVWSFSISHLYPLILHLLRFLCHIIYKFQPTFPSFLLFVYCTLSIA